MELEGLTVKPHRAMITKQSTNEPMQDESLTETQSTDGNQEYLTRCVVDPVKRIVYLYSNEGSERQVSCETVDEFMNVLQYVRDTLDETTVSYVNPL